MIDIDRLEDIFRKRYKELARGEEALDDDEFFVNWCDRHKVIMLHPEWMTDTLNEGKMKGRVCVHSPEPVKDAPPWLLVPKKLAMKVLVLGYLP